MDENISESDDPLMFAQVERSVRVVPPQAPDRFAHDLQVPLHRLPQETVAGVIRQRLSLRHGHDEGDRVFYLFEGSRCPLRPHIGGCVSSVRPRRAPILAECPLPHQVHLSAKETLQVFFQTEVAVEEI